MQFESKVNYLVGDAVLQAVRKSRNRAKDGVPYINDRDIIRNPDRIPNYEQTIRKERK